MKFILTIVTFFVLSVSFAQDLSEVNLANNTYEQARIPDFLPWVGKALSGRCFMASGSSKKLASVLLVSFEEEGFEVAPLDAEKKPADFFDKLDYGDVLNQFPIVKKMFLEVKETALGARIDKEIAEGDYRGELRESEKFIIMRVFVNEKIYKFCNYLKN